MLIERFILGLSTTLMTLAGTWVSGQDYPTRTLHIVTGGAGGGLDIAARQLAQGISGGLGQPVLVENRPPNIIAEVGAKAPADGYTTLSTTPAFGCFPSWPT